MTRVELTAKWTRGPADVAAVANGCWFDEAAGRHACEFIERFLRHSKGKKWAGKPFILLDWERDELIMPLFGWMRADDTRRFRKAWVEVPKKNGKSALASAIALYLLVADKEPGAEVYCAATTRDQAKIVYREAANMVSRSPALQSCLKVQSSRSNIEYESAKSFLRAISAEAGAHEGIDIHGLVFDELHALKDREFWDVLEYGMRARQQPLLFIITTAGVDRTTIGFELHEYAKRVIEGKPENQDDAFFALIYAADEDSTDAEYWTRPEQWRKANPSMGHLFSESDMAAMCEEAKRRPAARGNFLRRLLNVWTESRTAWLNQVDWQACGWGVDDPVRWRADQMELLKGQQCFGGLDLGSTGDFTALVLWFQSQDDAPSVLLPWFWLPAEGHWKQDTQRRALHDAWIRAGFITTTPGNAADYDHIRADIKAIADQFGIRDLAIDTVFQGAQLSTQLGEQDGMNVIAFRQGFLSMAAPTKEFEERVLRHTLAHGNNPVMDWMAANVAVDTDKVGNLKPVKPERKSPFKIDGMVCVVMALGRAMVSTGTGKSVYETRGVLQI